MIIGGRVNQLKMIWWISKFSKQWRNCKVYFSNRPVPLQQAIPAANGFPFHCKTLMKTIHLFRSICLIPDVKYRYVQQLNSQNPCNKWNNIKWNHLCGTYQLKKNMCIFQTTRCTKHRRQTVNGWSIFQLCHLQYTLGCTGL